MANKYEKRRFRRKVSDQIRAYGNLLHSSGILIDKGPLETAANDCKKGNIPPIKGIEIDYTNSWGYALSGLIISIPDNINSNGVLPEESYMEKVAIDAKVVGNFVRDDYLEDPFTHLEFNLVIKGKNKDGKNMTASWHLDRHPESDTGHSPVNIHPTYHFQYGGRKLTLTDSDYGTHLVLEIPRLMHLPLEGVLGIDFVIANFLGEKRSLLCGDQSYNDCLDIIQEYFWRPYIYALANKWSPYPAANVEWDYKLICPQLV